MKLFKNGKILLSLFAVSLLISASQKSYAQCNPDALSEQIETTKQILVDQLQKCRDLAIEMKTLKREEHQLNVQLGSKELALASLEDDESNTKAIIDKLQARLSYYEKRYADACTDPTSDYCIDLAKDIKSLKDALHSSQSELNQIEDQIAACQKEIAALKKDIAYN